MKLTAEARKARKESQLARLKAKSEMTAEDYSEFYAAQPIQVAKAACNAEINAARREVRRAKSSMDMAIATGQGFEAAEQAVAVAASRLAAAEAVKAARFPKGEQIALTENK